MSPVKFSHNTRQRFTIGFWGDRVLVLAEATPSTDARATASVFYGSDTRLALTCFVRADFRRLPPPPSRWYRCSVTRTRTCCTVPRGISCTHSRTAKLVSIAGTLLLLIVCAASSQTLQDGPGEWQYLTNENALETKKYLVLIGEVEDGGAQWIITRRCWSGLPVLQARAEEQGDALDLDHVYSSILRKNCTSRHGCTDAVRLWKYKTRYRVDSDPVGTWIWRYGWDSDGGWEQLWLEETWYGSKERGYTVGHSIDRLLSGDRLAIEISPSMGIAVFITAGFAEAKATFCGQEPWIEKE